MRKEINFRGHPEISFEELLDMYREDTILCLDDVLMNQETYHTVFQNILDIMKYGFQDKKYRFRTILFKIHTEDKKIHKIQLRHFLSNLILWYGFMLTDTVDVIDESYIVDIANMDISDVANYMDEKIISDDIDIATKNKIIDEIIFNIMAVSAAFTPLLGLGVSVYSIHQMAKKHPEIDQILHMKLDPNLQPGEVEEILGKATDRMIELFSSEPNDLQPMFKAGHILSAGQFREIAVMIGLKADMDGRTIPFLIDANLLVDGIAKPSHFYIDAQSGRKALVLSKTFMGKPGAFSKKITTNSVSAMLRKDYEMCNSIVTVDYYIINDKFLEMLDKRYYYDERGHLLLLDYKKDKHLIGKVVRFRSPATCTSKEGVCHLCYGDLYEVNKDLFSAGAFAATKNSNPLGQKVLGAKHEQLTSSQLIKFFNEEVFNKFFDLSAADITINADLNNADNFMISIEDIITEETDEGEAYYVTSFDLIDKQDNLILKVETETKSPLYLSPDLVAILKQGKVSLSAFDEDTALFMIEIQNQETTAAAKNVEKLINTKARMGCHTISELCQKLGEVMLESGINHPFTHNEMTIRNLLRKKSNILSFPDFTPNGDPEDYQILILDNAGFHNPSPIISLSAGKLRRQITGAEFFKKRAPSHLDPLFAPDPYLVVPEEYIEMAEEEE